MKVLRSSPSASRQYANSIPSVYQQFIINTPSVYLSTIYHQYTISMTTVCQQSPRADSEAYVELLSLYMKTARDVKYNFWTYENVGALLLSLTPSPLASVSPPPEQSNVASLWPSMSQVKLPHCFPVSTAKTSPQCQEKMSQNCRGIKGDQRGKLHFVLERLASQGLKTFWGTTMPQWKIPNMQAWEFVRLTSRHC